MASQFGAWWRQHRLTVLSVTAIAALLLAFFGANGDYLDKLDTTLRLLPIGLGIEAGQPAPVHVARVLATFVFAYATFRAFGALFGERLQEIRARFFRKQHTIVCGLGQRGVALTESLLRAQKKVVAIELDPSNLAVRQLRDKGVLVLVGDATDSEVLERARVRKAAHVVAVCPQDAINAQIGAKVLELSEEQKNGAARVFIHVSEPRLSKFLVQHAFERLEFFNIYERGAESLVQDTPSVGGDRPILVVGAGQFGLSLLSQLARERDRYMKEHGVGPLLVYVVDREATARAALLTEAYSRLREVCDLHTFDLDVDSPAFDRLVQQHPELDDAAMAFVCFDSDALTITTALNLLGQTDSMPVTARVLDGSRGMADLLQRTQGGETESARFRPLVIAERACNAKLILEGMRGRLAREVHASYRRDNPGTPDDVDWDDLTDVGRERNLAHADGIKRQLEDAGFRLRPLIDWGAQLELTPNDIEKLAEGEHERWMDERLEKGWRHGPVKDEVEKTHPSLVRWSELSEEVQDIDRNLVRAWPAMLARVGIEIYRRKQS